MFKWQKIIAVSLIVAGALGFKWSESIGAIFQSASADVSSNNQHASSLTDKFKQSVLASEPAVVYVDLLSIGMLATGVIWLTRRTNNRQTNSKLVLDFSKKSKQK